ncbi:type II toxin-antitoxin system ParD family antitoxin [Methylobacterium sp. NEAU 140]|uniref:type II toxin-antitoxin system ParD family antitoxin n=1 Tax=Methylobacterium sp. NEAU 140 TaxID=3064945 RepID=UPI0027339B39|nr:type II toxin-antitoxin system ParD family antitoxin [Methylobacterium sp. NEAU 140]MDP4024955.1 type II toxin-antitoxin system ParD family antitoxin [Methylobacterium sp. NEAU 140]
MPVRRTITVSITPEQEDLIRACLHSGRFASTSEVVRAALRLLDREEARDLAGRAKPPVAEGRA